MRKRYFFLVVALAGLLAAYQAKTALSPTAPAASPTIEILSTATSLPGPTRSPSPGTVPAEAAVCFISDPTPVAFFPDGKRILLRGDMDVQVFNLETMQAESVIENKSKSHLIAVSLSPNGETLAWSFEDFTIQLIRISDHRILSTINGHTNSVGKLLFSPEGKRLYSASHDTWLKVWDLDGSAVGAFQPTGADDFPSEVAGLGISADGSMLASLPYNGPVKLWSLPDFTLIRALGANGGYDYNDASFSPDGSLVAADTVNGLFLWETSTGKELLGGNPGINSAAVTFSPDGRYLAYALVGETNDIILASPDGAQTMRTLPGNGLPLWEMVFSPDGSRLVSGGVEIHVWQVQDGTLLSVGKSDCP
jgi:WD40 repeat protein